MPTLILCSPTLCFPRIPLLDAPHSMHSVALSAPDREGYWVPRSGPRYALVGARENLAHEPVAKGHAGRAQLGRCAPTRQCAALWGEEGGQVAGSGEGGRGILHNCEQIVDVERLGEHGHAEFLEPGGQGEGQRATGPGGHEDEGVPA